MALRLVLRGFSNCQVRNSSALTAKQVLSEGPQTQVTALSNGFRVASEDNGKATATVGVWIENGSRYETDSNNGISYFLEHMIYKGTGKRAQAQLETELEAIGAKLNSFTQRDQTAFYVQAGASDVEKVVDILADVLRNSKLDSAAVEAERQILLRKLEESDDDHKAVLFDNLHAAAFQGTPMARSPIGTTSALKNISAQQLREWMEDHYRPVRMVLSAVGGGCDHNKLVTLSNKYFGDLSNEYPRTIPQVSGIRFTGSEFRYRNDNVPHMYAALTVEGVGYGHNDALPLAVAAKLVGQWDVTHASSYHAPSRVVQKLCAGHGLHFFEQFNIQYKDTGLWGIYFVSDGDDLLNSSGIMSSIQHEWKHLASALEDHELDRIRNLFRTDFYQSVETNTQKAAFIAKELLYTDKVRSLAEIEERLQRTDKNAVMQAVSRHVYDRDLATAGVGRTEAFPHYQHTRFAQSWWRL